MVIFRKKASIIVDSFEQSLVGKVKLIDGQEEQHKTHIYAITDMAVANQCLKRQLSIRTLKLI